MSPGTANGGAPHPTSRAAPLPTLCVGLSPCPNDTYLVHGWVKRRIPCDLHLQPAYADIETLNQLALQNHFPISKVSAALLPSLPRYRLLPCGAALRRGEGPKIIAAKPFSPEDLSCKSLAFPGRLTAAYTLYQRLCPKPRLEQFWRYDKLLDRVKTRAVDAAVVIHESRFTFAQQGLVEIADLGDLWNQRTQLPVPLGIFVARDDVSQIRENQVVDHLRRSLAFAKSHPKASQSYIAQWAFETSQEVCQQHIAHYITGETHTLSQEGRSAIGALTLRDF